MRKSGKKEIFNEAVSRNRTWDPWILPLLALVFWVLNRQLKGQEKVRRLWYSSTPATLALTFWVLLNNSERKILLLISDLQT